MSQQVSNIRDRIDQGPVSFAQFIIISLGFILNCVDGFDVVAISVAAPSITTQWGINSVEMGYVLSAALGGMMFGAGWAITGACPGPIYAQIGGGEWMSSRLPIMSQCLAIPKKLSCCST